MSVLEAVLVEWTKRVGPEAAAHRVRYYQLWLKGWLSAVVGGGLLMGGGISGLTAVTLVGGAALVAWLVLTLRSFVELQRMNAAIRESLGVTFGFFGGPSSYRGKYLEWCERHEVAPYPFLAAAPPAVTTHWL